MSTMRITMFSCWAIAFGAAFLGYAEKGLWLGCAAALACSLVWIFARRRFPAHCLLASSACAAVGILLGDDAPLFLLSAGASLSVWDLCSVESLGSGRFQERASLRYVRLRIASLCWAPGATVLLAIALRRLRIELSFWSISGLALVGGFGFYQFLRVVRR